MNNALAVSPADIPMRRRPSKEDTRNRGELNSITIEMTENGCIVRCCFDPKDLDPKKDRWSQMPEDEKYSFDDVDKAAEYVKAMMHGQMEYEDGEEGGGKKRKAPAGAKKEEE